MLYENFILGLDYDMQTPLYPQAERVKSLSTFQ